MLSFNASAHRHSWRQKNCAEPPTGINKQDFFSLVHSCAEWGGYLRQRHATILQRVAWASPFECAVNVWPLRTRTLQMFATALTNDGFGSITTHRRIAVSSKDTRAANTRC